jgi:uncharacterized repeat protein (TIGR04076 family)
MEDLRVTVEEVLGFCDLPMRPGDGFEVRGGALVFPEGGRMCLWALSSLIPFFPAKQRCGEDPNDWIPRCERLACPDPNGRVIFRVERIPSGKAALPDRAAVEAPASEDRSSVAGGSSGEEPLSLRRTSLRLKVNPGLCTGCRACELACCEAHDEGYLPDLARLRVDSEEESCADEPRVCRQCGVAACVRACPVGALYRDPKTAAVRVDPETCTGCGLCGKACPFGAMPFDFRTRKAMPCDLCGGSPSCVERCPAGALELLRLGD